MGVSPTVGDERSEKITEIFACEFEADGKIDRAKRDSDWSDEGADPLERSGPVLARILREDCIWDFSVHGFCAQENSARTLRASHSERSDGQAPARNPPTGPHT